MIYTMIFILLLYCNLIRYFELRQNTSMSTWKQYWFKCNGILYSFNIIIISIIIYLSTVL